MSTMDQKTDDIDALERILFLNTHVALIVEVINGEMATKRKFRNSITLRDLVAIEFQHGDEKAASSLILCFISDDGRYAVQARNNHLLHHPDIQVLAFSFHDPVSLSALDLYDRFFNEQYESMEVKKMASICYGEGSESLIGAENENQSKITKWMASYLESTRKLPRSAQDLNQRAPIGKLDSFSMLEAAVFDPTVDAHIVEVLSHKIKHALTLPVFTKLQFSADVDGHGLARDKVVIFVSSDGKSALLARDNYRKYHSEVRSLAFESDNAANTKVIDYWIKSVDERMIESFPMTPLQHLKETKSFRKMKKTLSRTVKYGNSKISSPTKSPLRLLGITSSHKNDPLLPPCQHGYQYKAHVEQVRHAHDAAWSDRHPPNFASSTLEIPPSESSPTLKASPSRPASAPLSSSSPITVVKVQPVESKEEIELLTTDVDLDLCQDKLEKDVAHLKNEMVSLGETLRVLRSRVSIDVSMDSTNTNPLSPINSPNNEHLDKTNVEEHSFNDSNDSMDNNNHTIPIMDDVDEDKVNLNINFDDDNGNDNDNQSGDGSSSINSSVSLHSPTKELINKRSSSFTRGKVYPPNSPKTINNISSKRESNSQPPSRLHSPAKSRPPPSPSSSSSSRYSQSQPRQSNQDMRRSSKGTSSHSNNRRLNHNVNNNANSSGGQKLTLRRGSSSNNLKSPSHSSSSNKLGGGRNRIDSNNSINSSQSPRKLKTPTSSSSKTTKPHNRSNHRYDESQQEEETY